MIDTLNIGEFIYDILSSDTELSSTITKIYPVIADNDAKMPFCVYHRVGLTSTPVKTSTSLNDYNLVEDNVHIEINIISNKYSNGLAAANRIRTLLQHDRIYKGMHITDVSIETAAETYNGDAYVQTMQFSLNIQKYQA